MTVLELDSGPARAKVYVNAHSSSQTFFVAKLHLYSQQQGRTLLSSSRLWQIIPVVEENSVGVEQEMSCLHA